jgi:hypothetical protein
MKTHEEWVKQFAVSQRGRHPAAALVSELNAPGVYQREMQAEPPADLVEQIREAESDSSATDKTLVAMFWADRLTKASQFTGEDYDE